jgi:lipid-A-disaccharide synthase
VGNLIVEGVKPEYNREEGLSRWNLNPDKPIIGILPGSRLYHMQDSLPVFLKVVEEVREAEPDVQFVLGLSPFLDIEEVRKTLNSPGSPIGGIGGSITNSGSGLKILTQGGVQITIMQSMQHDLMNMVDMVLTIPGTNTAECAFLGKPMVVVCSWKARIPSGGLGFIMNSIPICNFRKKLYQKVLKRIRYISLPNTIAQKNIVPEVIVDEEASEITEVVLDLIRDKSRMDRISGELKEAMGEAGAADRITDTIIEILNGSES